MVKQAGAALSVPEGASFRHSARNTRRQQTGSENTLNTVLKTVADGVHFDLKQASDLMRSAALQDPSLTEKLVKFARAGKASTDEVIRIIRILECICSKSELLAHLLTLEFLDQPRIRSKVVLTIGRLVQNTAWLCEQLQDANPRVRANAIEALWEVRVQGAEEPLLKAALDSNNRVIGNAAYGLYKLGNPKAISILYSLLRHSDKLFRSTGLWTITQLGDPRFLGCVQTSDTGPLIDEEEKAAEENARQRLTARLRSSQFAGKLTLDLSSFGVTGKARTAKLSCLSSESGVWHGRSDLNALHFVIEEGGKQVEEFQFRWIDSAAKISSVVIAPAGLGVRSQPMRALTERVTDGETVSLLRYLPSAAAMGRNQRNWLADNQAVDPSNGLSSQNFSVTSSLHEAISKGLERLNDSHGPRHLFLVLDRSVEEKLPANIQKLVRTSNSMLHVLASEDACAELCQALNTLSLKSGGTFLRSHSADQLSVMAGSVRARHASSCELSWIGSGESSAEVKISCISGCGYGEVAIFPHRRPGE